MALPPGPAQSGMPPPPVTPPEVPSLSTYAGGSGEAPAAGGRSQAVQKLVYEIESALDMLAEMAPGAADLADEAKITVRAALKSALGVGGGATVGRGTLIGPAEGEQASGNPPPPRF